MQLDSEHLLQSLRAGFISRNLSSDNYLMPTLLVNDYKKGKKILSAIQDELLTCDAFDFSVAFINNRGLAAIKLALDYLEKHNIKGRILTTNYLNFTHPSALQELLDFSNIELKIYDVTKNNHRGFHPKGYIFRHSNYTSIIIGSANLTDSALSLNQEWSIKLLSCTDGQIVYNVQEEFQRIWQEAESVTSQWLKDYSSVYTTHMTKLKLINNNLYSDNNSEEQLEIIPNKMQQEAMSALSELRAKNETRALLIAATGTGKTYLSIFDVAQLKPEKVLYIAHRDMILNKSEKSFRNVLPNIKTGFLNGSQKDTDADYLFASIFTLSKDETLHSFKKNEFDYIIIDEVHHAGAGSYQKVIDYFKPKFLLGLTATPERTDGFDIFSLFHNNIPYEIRLQKAMEEDLLCPFHYYGLSDLTIDGEIIDDKADFSKLVNDERIRHISAAMKRYKNSAYPVKGLIFCSRVDEARELSLKLNSLGFITKYLTGEHSDSERENIIQELESDTNPLQYIISVDIFNEGVDIPSVNQVVMLRPTQSAIIFVQQLGRGLRKTKEKSYVSVIDFIGNYENNFFIPIALYGDNSYNKDNLRKALSTGSSNIPGTSTVQITEIARQKIYKAISETSFSQLKLLRTEYEKLKMRLARVPSMMDFVNNGFIDPFLFIDYKGSYYNFKCTVEKKAAELSLKQLCSLQFFSLEFARGIRLHELLLVSLLISQEKIYIDSFASELSKYNIKLNQDDLNGMFRLLSPDFYTQNDKKKYGGITYIKIMNNEIIRTDEFSSLLNSKIYRDELSDCLEYGMKRALIRPEEKSENNNLVLYRKYSRKDICKLLNWKTDCSATIYGYKTETAYSEYTCPIFVTYEKSNDISETTKYEDVFIDNSRFSWMSRSRRTSQTEEVATLINQPTNNIKIMLFIKKNDGEGSDFYYLGKMRYNSFEDTQMKDKNGAMVPVVNIQFDMENPVPQNLYSYLENIR